MKHIITTALLLIALQLSANAQNSMKRTLRIGKEEYVFAFAWPDADHNKARNTEASRPVTNPAKEHPTTTPVIAQDLTHAATNTVTPVKEIASAPLVKQAVPIAKKESKCMTASASIAASVPANKPIPVRPLMTNNIQEQDSPVETQTAKRTKPASAIYTPQKEYVKTDNTCFPLIKDRQYNVYDFLIPVDDSRVVARYKPYFDRHKLKFSGYVWEEVLKAMLNDADPEISRYIVLRSESGRVMIKVTRHQVIKEFPDYICHIFSNLIKFDEYLGKMDKTKLPDY